MLKRSRERYVDGTENGLMVIARVDPHWHGFSSAFETHALIEFHRIAIGNQHLLMKSTVLFFQTFHNHLANTTPLIFGVDEQVWK